LADTIENAFFQQLQEDLKNHTWTFKTDNFAAYLEAQAKERLLFEKALKNSLPGVQLYIQTQLNALTNLCELRAEKERSTMLATLHRAVSDALDTGDKEYDSFRARCNRHNWNWEAEEDSSTRMAGQREEEAIQLSVMAQEDPRYKAYYTYAKNKFTH
jgi:hypothetical protein